ncbi:UNVERIFIED_CONTAM: hypothetical protein GTU68_034774 [Idotea baltica]|nr:hypothetical protein [Idotea baltica]
MVVDQNMAGAELYLQQYGSVELVNGRTLSRHDLRSAQALLVRSVTQVDEALLAGTGVRFVGTATSGIDHIDRHYLQENNIGFAYAPGSNANSVVEYVLCAIAAVDKKLEQLLSGGTLAIVGYGHIGRLLAGRLGALGIDFKVYDPWLESSQIPNAASFAEILACDVISIHVELTHKQPWPSFHLLGEGELQQIDSQALLINASRGAVIDNTALEAQLKSGAGPICVLDVWEDEPLVSEELLAMVRFGSAHIAGYSMDAKLLATRMLGSAMTQHFDSLSENSAPLAGVEAPVFDLTKIGGASVSDSLRLLLQQSYDLGFDDQLLRASVSGQLVQAASFDSLRKNYRSRREIYGCNILVDAPGTNVSKIFAAMGCSVSDGSAGKTQ